MINDLRKIELLAPAKNKECAFAAINAGADAVYIGAEAFGARKKAGNTIEDINEIVEYAHKFLVKIYVTVNTILYDNEIDAAEKLIWKLYDAGVDAVIFQDFSFFKMNLPPIALHASTQCNNDTLDKIKFLKSMNVERVVLPREFSLSEIRNVTQNVDIETEVFIHGALCVSYSGQCYLSNFIGGRSANRGECAQPCRKKYSLIDENGNFLIKDKYLLSMKDNNMSTHLKELLDAGVTSLKIEGRLKDKEYVTNVVSYYRKKIDLLQGSMRVSEGRVFSDFVPDINKTFNRDYTDFFFDGKRKIFINPDTPKFVGEKIGKVLSVKGNSLKIDTKIQLNISDKLTFFDNTGELTGTTITRINGTFIEVLNASAIQRGCVVYKNFDAKFDKSLKSSGFTRKIPLVISIKNDGIVLKSFGNNEYAYYFTDNFELAQNIERAKETAVKQLSKLGDTEFYADNVTVSDDFNLFIPVSKLNEIRRTAIENLRNISKNNYRYKRRNNHTGATQYPVKVLDSSFNISNNFAKAFYEQCGSNVRELAPECGGNKKNIILMKTKHCLRDFAGICLKKTKDNKKLYLVDEYGTKYPLNFDCKNCIMKIETSDI